MSVRIRPIPRRALSCRNSALAAASLPARHWAAATFAVLLAAVTASLAAQESSHWADTVLRHPELPRVTNADWPRQALDCFVLARLEREGWTPNPEADRYALIRRLYLDLVGLPPPVEAVDAFVHDPRPDAYEKLVDRLLSSVHYGERWARWWLDLARYADSNGYESDEPRSMWPYRDWVIEAFNRNLPFDRFTTEQLAGDLLPNHTQDQLIATGFHRNTMINTEGGVKEDEYKDAAVKDRVDTTATVWLASTLNCAQCHDHKYDPVSQQEYYQLYAFFNNTTDRGTSPFGGTDGNDTLRVFFGNEDRERIARLRDEVKRFEKLAADDKTDEAKASVEKAKKALAEYLETCSATTMVLREGEARETRVQKRGDFLSLDSAVQAEVPKVFGLPLGDAARNRLALARWLTDRGNPRTARVTVNRVWSVIFGQGLVATSEDFGVQGELPTHPQLLDWLATEFAAGWDVKALIRRIVTASTYRQSSVATAEKLGRDRFNQLLARGPRFRVEAESVRDIALEVGGLLVRNVGGPSVFPPQPDSLWDDLFVEEGFKKWPTSKGADRYRRGLYTFIKRTALHPLMRNFDAPNRSICTVNRKRSNSPLAALHTLNDPAFVEAAGGLARRMMSHAGDLREQALFGFRICVARRPRPEELQRVVGLFTAALEHYTANPHVARGVVGSAFLTAPAHLDPLALAAWVNVASTLLNMDATLTKG